MNRKERRAAKAQSGIDATSGVMALPPDIPLSSRNMILDMLRATAPYTNPDPVGLAATKATNCLLLAAHFLAQMPDGPERRSQLDNVVPVLTAMIELNERARSLHERCRRLAGELTPENLDETVRQVAAMTEAEGRLKN